MYDNRDTQLENVILENKDLKRALKQLKNTLDRTLDDYETLKTIHEEFKGHYSKQREELSENAQRMQVMISERREMEGEWENKIRQMKSQIDEKRRELELAQGKLLPNLDTDMIRVRLLNEIEGPHRIELDTKQAEIDRLLEKQYDLKRQLDLSNARYELIQEETQRNLRELRERHKLELKDVMLEVQINQEKAVETKKERETAKMYKKEAEDLRTEIFSKDEHIFNLKKSLDAEKDDKSEQIERLVNQIEDIREKYRQQLSDNEKLNEHIADLETEIKRSYEKQSHHSMHSAHGPVTTSFSEQSPKKIHYQEEQISQMRDHDWVVKSLQSRIQEQKSKFEEEIQTNRQTEKRMEVQIDKLRKEKRDLQSELNKIVSETGDKIAEERRRVLDLQTQNKDLQRDKDQLVDSLRQAQQNIHSIKLNPQSQQNKSTLNETSTSQVDTLVKKNHALKQKLKEANTKIMSLLSEKIHDKKREQDMTVMQQHNQVIKEIQGDHHLMSQDNGFRQFQMTAAPLSATNSAPGSDNAIRVPYHAKNFSNQRLLNMTAPVIQTANTSMLGGLSSIHSRQNTGNFMGTEMIRTDLNNQRERLSEIRDHIEDIHRVSNQQFYKPY